MNEEDIKYIKSLIDVSKNHTLKKRRIFRNVMGAIILLWFPILGMWGFLKTANRYKMEWQELLLKEQFSLGFLLGIMIVLPLIILCLHIKENGNYDDLKKNDLIVDLYQENEKYKKELEIEQSRGTENIR